MPPSRLHGWQDGQRCLLQFTLNRAEAKLAPLATGRVIAQQQVAAVEPCRERKCQLPAGNAATVHDSRKRGRSPTGANWLANDEIIQMFRGVENANRIGSRSAMHNDSDH